MSRPTQSGHSTFAHTTRGIPVVTLSLLAATCLLFAGCSPKGQKAKNPAPASASAAAPAASVSSAAALTTGGTWDGGPNSEDYTLLWDDGLDQSVSIICTDDHDFFVEALMAKTVNGKAKTGRVYLGDPANPGQAKVYTGAITSGSSHNDYLISVPPTADFLSALDGATSLTVEIGEARVSPGVPPQNLRKDFNTACAPRQGTYSGPAAAELPLPVAAASDAASATAAATSGAPIAQRVFRDSLKGGQLGPELVVVPAGDFVMGSPATEKKRAANEPQRPIHIGYALAVGRFPVSVHEYRTCVAAGGCKPPEWLETDRPVDPLAPGDPYASLGTSLKGPANPIVGISWDDAKAYVSWLSRSTGQTYRLLSEAEWEYAARAGSKTAYPWGDKVGVGRAHCFGCGSPWNDKMTAPVGSFQPNAFGVYDTVGNVSQWVEDCADKEAVTLPSDGSAYSQDGCAAHTVRGGPYWLKADQSRSASRSALGSDQRQNDLGFRIARVVTR